MKFEIIRQNEISVLELTSENEEIKSVQDALDLLGDCWGNDVRAILASARHFSTDFFDLKTRLAGEILQKYENYGIRLAIVGDFSGYESKSLRDFIYECNRGKKIRFAETRSEALDHLVLS
ncbi:DUF4180 domain-containing protein [Leptospira gomenensis]|uniref:DUF4180 domain-containing protein n=1 Tax=Leptospira gomenensis TaxID=2484974 RepID=A0A5F1YV04_9LEPT|nr:DUF4180 domain-containing protein [Leptospira gomenensis]TGK31684.1 DUF4180 domain-containing protein [Leptospira gomenensis]TGK41687.1 DUF4180 domain-containing protein [Leptospira gomenensis]TGK43359.1 DUF4180 domain-containing protein [Leptospira gomenensis]TGK61353.1 DUF4180 domain-containing protein [Leptospira gomenensis]